jgi:hypothetical protein
MKILFIAANLILCLLVACPNVKSQAFFERLIGFQNIIPTLLEGIDQTPYYAMAAARAVYFSNTRKPIVSRPDEIPDLLGAERYGYYCCS